MSPAFHVLDKTSATSRSGPPPPTIAARSYGTQHPIQVSRRGSASRSARSPARTIDPSFEMTSACGRRLPSAAIGALMS